MAAMSIKEKIKAGAAVIDVRTADEFADGAYPGAKNIPVDVIQNKLDQVGPKDKSVIVYCASGGRSAAAQKILRASGFTDVTNAGGLDDMPE